MTINNIEKLTQVSQSVILREMLKAQCFYKAKSRIYR